MSLQPSERGSVQRLERPRVEFIPATSSQSSKDATEPGCKISERSTEWEGKQHYLIKPMSPHPCSLLHELDWIKRPRCITEFGLCCLSSETVYKTMPLPRPKTVSYRSIRRSVASPSRH